MNASYLPQNKSVFILDPEKPASTLTDKSNIMKRRVRKIANFFAFNLLFFALYLNFIHKDKVAITENTAQQNSAAFSGTVLVENPAAYTNKNATPASQPEIKTTQDEVAALKLSIN